MWRSRVRIRLLLAAVALLQLLAGCATGRTAPPLQPGQTVDDVRAILGDAMRRPLFALRATGGDLMAYGVDLDGDVENKGRLSSGVLLFVDGRYLATLDGYVATLTAPCLTVPGGRDAIAVHLRALAADPSASARIPAPLPPADGPLAECTERDVRGDTTSAAEWALALTYLAYMAPVGVTGMVLVGPFVPSMKAADERRRVQLEGVTLGMERRELERIAGAPDSAIGARPVEGEVWRYDLKWDPDVFIGLERDRVVWVASETWADCFRS